MGLAALDYPARLVVILLIASVIGLILRKVNGNSSMGAAGLMSPRKKCNECKSWIDQQATRCKYCSSDQRNNYFTSDEMKYERTEVTCIKCEKEKPERGKKICSKCLLP